MVWAYNIREKALRSHRWPKVPWKRLRRNKTIICRPLLTILRNSARLELDLWRAVAQEVGPPIISISRSWVPNLSHWWTRSAPAPMRTWQNPKSKLTTPSWLAASQISRASKIWRRLPKTTALWAASGWQMIQRRISTERPMPRRPNPILILLSRSPGHWALVSMARFKSPLISLEVNLFFSISPVWMTSPKSRK